MKAIAQVFVFDVISRVLMGCMTLMLIRFMPEREFVLYTMAFALIAVVTETLSSSFNRIYIIGYQDLGFKELSSSFLGLQILMVSALIVLAWPLNAFLNGAYGIMALLVLSNCLVEFCKTTFQQKSRFLFFSLIEFTKNMIFIAGLAILIYLKRYQLQAVPVLAIQALAMLVVVVFFCRYCVDFKKFFNLDTAGEMLTKITRGRYKHLFGYFFILSFFVQLDVFMLKGLATDRVLATYSSAFRYYSLLMLLLGSVHTVLLPTIQQVTTFAQWRDILDRLNKLFFCFLGVAVVAAWCAQWVIPWVDKGKYPDAVIVFQILTVSAVISLRCSPYVNLLMSFSDFKFLFGLIIAAVLINIILNITLVPILAAVGTAIATLISSAFVTMFIYVRATKFLQSRFSSEYVR